MLAPDDPVVFARHAVVDLYLGRNRQVLEKLDALLESDLTSVDLQLNRLLALRALGRYEDAQRAYLAYVSTREGSPTAGPPVPTDTLPLTPPAAPVDPLRPDQ